jgi:hypothetical protein
MLETVLAAFSIERAHAAKGFNFVPIVTKGCAAAKVLRSRAARYRFLSGAFVY